jgi:hypothetical protein
LVPERTPHELEQTDGVAHCGAIAWQRPAVAGGCVALTEAGWKPFLRPLSRKFDRICAKVEARQVTAHKPPGSLSHLSHVPG